LTREYDEYEALIYNQSEIYNLVSAVQVQVRVIISFYLAFCAVIEKESVYAAHAQ
jgi:hypothetical protein